jgi:heptosyltransferase-2
MAIKNPKIISKVLKNLQPAKILIRSTNWIGDAIMTTPAVRTIRENFPQAHIAILVHPWVADVFSASPHVDEIILYQKKSGHRGLGGMWRLSAELGSADFDLAILLQNAFEAALITFLAQIPVRAGYNRDGRGLLLTHPVPLAAGIKKIHQVHYYQGLVQELGLNCGPDDLFLQNSAENRRWAAKLIKESSPTGPVIGLNPGAAYGPAKRWPAEKYADLSARLVQELQATIVVFGTTADRQAAEIIQKRTNKPIIDLCGKTSLGQALAVIKECHGFVTNDSGLMHVGAALKTPLVAIFGSTNHITTGPFSNNSVVLRKELSCSPCLKPDCRKNFECMMRIGVDEVFSHVCKLLEK